MAPLRQHPGGLTPGGPASRNQHPLGTEHRVVGGDPLPSGLGVDGAVNYGVLLDPAHAALLTGDTGPDTGPSASPQLVDIFRVGQQGPSHANDVTYAVRQSGQRPVRVVHAPGAKDGDIHRLPYQLRIGHVQPLLLIHRRVAPPPGIVGAHVHIQRIISIRGQQLCRLYTLVQITALFLKLLAGQRPLTQGFDKTLGTVPQDHWEILPATGLDLLHNLPGETQPVFQAAAVLVGAVVEQGDGKLVDEVALMDGVDLHAVKSCPLSVVSSLAEAADQGVDLLHGQLPAYLVQPAVLDGRGGHRRKLPQIGGDGHPAEAAGHLQKNLRVISVDPLRHLPGGTHKLDRVVSGVGAVWHAVLLNLVVHKGNAGEDQPNATFRPGSVVVDPPLVKAPLCVSQAKRAHRRHGKAVFECKRSNLDLREKQIVLCH